MRAEETSAQRRRLRVGSDEAIGGEMAFSPKASCCSATSEASVCYKVPSTSLRSGSFVFLLGFVWHIKLLPLFHAFAGREWLATISLHPDFVHTFRELDLRDPKMAREFALMGAFTHTFVFIIGLLTALVFQRLYHSYYKSKESQVRSFDRATPMSGGAVLAWGVPAAMVFHRVILHFLRYCYEVRFSPVVRFANMFFHEQEGQVPFAWASSVSYTCVLVLGFIMSSEHHRLRFERVILPSETLRGWAVPITLAFVGWVGTMQTVTVPLFLSSLKDEENIAFIIGVMICSAVPVLYTLVRSSGVRLSGLSEAPRGAALTEVWAVLLEVMHTLVLSWLFASFLVTIAMYANERVLDPQAFELLFNNAYFTRLCLLLLACSVMRPLARGEVTFAQALEKILRKVKEIAVITVLWNAHLVTFFGICGAPFVCIAALKSSGILSPAPAYTYVDAFVSWFSFINFGPYGGQVFYQGPVRAMCVRFKINWVGLPQFGFYFLSTIPLLYPNYIRWTSGAADFHVYFAMSAIHLAYLLTYRGEPEKNCESRLWPHFCERMQGVVEYIESYFRFSIRVEDPSWAYSVNVEEPRIFGFHPHGVYPCAVIWIPLSRTFSRLFGSKVKVHSVTDFFTHIVPLMRDICQWGGGVEVCKKVVDQMLTEKRNIMIVPGGQKEILLHTWERMEQKEIALYAGHKGFIRMAMRHGATLVPTFHFGELQNLENIRLPKLQQFARKFLGFPMPFIPVGMCNVLPIPRNLPTTYVIGSPIKATCTVPGSPTEAEVKALHQEYYASLKALIEKHKESVGQGDYKVVLYGLE